MIWNPRYELAPPESPGEPPADGGGAAGRVLVIGNDPGLSRVIKVNLTVRGYRVETAATPVAAVPPNGRRPGLVILDLGVTDADDMASVMAVHGRPGHVPVLAISARDSEEVKRAALAAGAADFLAKPFHIDDLLLKVRRAISPCREEDDTARR